MATNDFKPFATGAGANVTSQADWESLPALPTGFTAGKASSAQVNKALRQPSTIAAMVGEFIANANIDAIDDGDVGGLVDKFTNALSANLELGTASKKNVGTGTNQIPDMSSFAISELAPTTQGYAFLPSGIIFQWGYIIASNSDVTTTLPIPFPNSFLTVLASSGYTPGAGVGGVSYIGTSLAAANRTSFTSRNSSPTLGSRYLAIGF
ncbi:hypothetical protein EN46_02090 [Citrobacter amalonaticus]